MHILESQDLSDLAVAERSLPLAHLARDLGVRRILLEELLNGMISINPSTRSLLVRKLLTAVGSLVVIVSFVALNTWNPSPLFCTAKSQICPKSRASI